MHAKKMKMCDVYVHPGEVANLALPLPQHYSCAPLYMPIKVIHGTKEGPCLVVFSGLTGTELNGLEIANRLVQETKPKELSGTVIAIPVMNIYGLTHYPSTLPVGNHLERCFPGDEHGSYGERMAHLFTQEILKKADYCIELQTGAMNHNILPQVYCNFDNKVSRKLAKVFRSPVVTNVSLEDNALRQTTEDLQIPLLVYQAGEAMRFDEHAINLGVTGINHVMAELNMVSPLEADDSAPIFSQDEEWITAHKGGILHTSISLGQTIEKGELIGSVSDPFGADVVESITSQQKGIVVGVNTAPLIHEGLPIFKIASFLDYDKAETVIEEWDKQQPDNYTGS